MSNKNSGARRSNKPEGQQSRIEKTTQAGGKPTESARATMARYAFWNQLISNNLSLAIKYGAFVIIVYFVTDAVKGIAGTQTKFEFITKFFANSGFAKIALVIFGAGGLLYGGRQRSLRKKRVEELSIRNAKLEQMIDPGRTSSNLLSSGNTRPEDKI